VASDKFRQCQTRRVWDDLIFASASSPSSVSNCTARNALFYTFLYSDNPSLSDVLVSDSSAGVLFGSVHPGPYAVANLTVRRTTFARLFQVVESIHVVGATISDVIADEYLFGVLQRDGAVTLEDTTFERVTSRGVVDTSPFVLAGRCGAQGGWGEGEEGRLFIIAPLHFFAPGRVARSSCVKAVSRTARLRDRPCLRRRWGGHWSSRTLSLSGAVVASCPPVQVLLWSGRRRSG